MRGLVWGIAVAGLLASFPAVRAVNALATVRAERAALAAELAAGPPRSTPLVEPGRARVAAGRKAAQGMLADETRRRARAGGVLVERLDAATGQDAPGLAAIRVRLSGSEKAVLALVGELERERPVTRFRAWRLAADADGRLTLDAVLVAPWR
ncbi:hypothetical protein GO308_03060 [Sphingomonas sp. SFZ2018-12]|uniref:hypothetical protein n=1 Tax=Sphingomonas sp. SFZ2018-12 TaxID=2683197 RepID=UPI001F0E3E6D|nr:hypothetical protein [Sphingomonas sp. SFZ2018-12]MCH4892089.1 hypothetical protein [Sphingomonas sp. SFZ2018-12]